MPRLAVGRRRAVRLLPCAALLVAATLALRAEDWKTVDGKVYRNVTVLSHTRVTVTILDSDGGATLNLLVLPPEIQGRFDIDRAAALAAKQKDDAEAAAQAAAVQAQKDKAVADEKAQVEAIAADKAFLEKERADAKKQLQGFNSKAAADYAAGEKAVVTGRVFFTTSDQQEVDYGGIHVRLFSFDQAHAALDLLSDQGDAQQKKLEPTLDEERQAYAAASGAAPAVGAGKKDAAAAKKTDDALKLYHDTWLNYYSYVSQDYFEKGLNDPVADVVTGPDGKFTISIPKGGSWVLVALGQKSTGPNTDNHLWIAKVDPAAVAKGEVTLNNDNLTGDDSLMTVMSDGDITSLVQNKMDELTKK